ncbi:MAG TPA: MFS transporter, partial [Phnomibacter sp.]|nr:MFS transporter [Phnomibacter sp.]
VADRFFAAQRLLGVLHLAGAALLYYASLQPSFEGFYPAIFAYMAVYMPTLALVNSVAFGQMQQAEKEFARIRVWGTAGWIVAGLLIGWLQWEAGGQLVNTFRLTAVVSGLLGLYSFTLPHTPPAARGKQIRLADVLGLEALSLLKQRNFLVFFAGCILICIPLAFYYQQTNVFLNELGLPRAAATMSLGQMSELAFMVVMPWFFKRLGVKYMLLVAMAAWVLRYVLFAYGSPNGVGLWMLYAGIILHGICYDFFFVTGQIYTDAQAGLRIRSAAQGMITLATYGVGMLIGFWLAGKVANHYAAATGHTWQPIWMIPAAVAAAVGLLFWLLFSAKAEGTPAMPGQ